MSSSIWHPADELPVRVCFPSSTLYIVIADDEYLSTALYRPISRKLAPFDWEHSTGFRRWFDWGEGGFTRWAYVSDILNIE